MLQTVREVESAKKELAGLAQKVDLWVNTPMSEKKQAKVKGKIEELNAKLNEIDIMFLETKLSYYRDIYEEIKK